MISSAFKNLVKRLNSKHHGIHCAHINVNGLLHKLDEIRLLLSETKIDILAITETHLHDNITDTDIDIVDYSIIRKDRLDQKNNWGGVLLYFCNHLEIHQITVPRVSMEDLWIELIVKSQKLLVGCIYRPPHDKKFFQQFQTALENIGHRANILILGDFNVDLSKVNTMSNDFKQILHSVNLTNIITKYTLITDKSMTMIDLVISSDTSKIVQCGTYETGISDHDLIFATFNMFKPKFPPKLITVRNYKGVDTEKVKQDLECVPWDIVSMFEDVDDSLWCWNHLLKDVISEHVKTRKVKVRSNNQPWMTGEIRKIINNRYKLLKKARTTPRHSTEWKEYRKAKNACTNLIRLTKANYWKNEFLLSDSVKSFWKTVRKFQGVQKSKNIGPLLDHNKNSTATKDTEKANLLNDFFANIGKNLATVNKTHESQLEHIYRVTPTIDHINLNPELITKSFRAAVKPGKACGEDNITSNDLNLHGEISIEGLRRVAQCSIKSGKFPTSWKKAKVTAVFKKGSKSECTNYRPISLLSVPSKVIEHLLCSQLKSHLLEHNLQNEHQWGFRPKRSTEDALLYMTEKWRKAIDSGKVVGIVFIDFKKAFDSVSHQILLKKLSACGVSGDCLSYLESYLLDRKQSTTVNGAISNVANVEYGVPQGSLVGPPCFSAYVNDMQENLGCDLDQFADDSTLHDCSDTVDNVISSLQKNVLAIQNYSSRNSLTIHPDKCEVVIISKQRFIGPLPKIEINGKSIAVVKASKCLGITIDQDLSWEDHVQSVSKNFSGKIKKLFQMRSLPKSTLSTIYHQGILPSVMYGISIWGNCSPTIMARLEKIHTRAARYINKVKKSVPDNLILQHTGWCPLTTYYKRSLACKTYKILNNLSSPLLDDLITKTTSTRVTRNSLKVDPPKYRYVDYKRSFRYRAAHIWNNIPVCIREKASYDSYKYALKKSDALEKLIFTKNNVVKGPNYRDYIYF